jgi:hypothetical protein
MQVCDIDEARLKEYLTNGVAALRAHPEGFRGIHVQSETSYFRGYLWGIKVRQYLVESFPNSK